ncbi:MAG: hypothetical protein SGILL_002227 [Bacillariaceae sp.]
MSASERKQPPPPSIEISEAAIEAAAAAAAEAASRALGITTSPLQTSDTMGYGLFPPQLSAASAVAPLGGYAGLEARFHPPPAAAAAMPNYEMQDSLFPMQQQQQHPHHMGKKPPPPSKKKRKPTAKAAAASAATPKRSGRPPKRTLSRQGSSNLSSRTARNIPRLHITNDEEPDRLSNPLLAMVAESSKKSGAAAAAAAADDDRTTAASIVATPNTLIPAGELMNSASIVFARPDTYPLSYLARVLGFDVDVPDMKEYLQQEGNEQVTTTDNALLPPFPTALPDPQTLPFKEDKVFLQVPERGLWFEQQKLQESVDHTNGLGDRDDQQLLDYMDPVYKSLLQHGWDPAQMTPSTGKASAKFIKQQEVQKPAREALAATARKELGLSEDWTFRDYASFAEEQEKKRLEQEQQQQMKARAGESALVAATATGNSAEEKGSGSTRRSSQSTPMWTINGNEVFGHLPLHHFGIIACYKEKPVAMFKYQFQWYYLPNPDATEEQGSESNQPMEAELVMVISGFGKPVQQEETAGPSASSEGMDDGTEAEQSHSPGESRNDLEAVAVASPDASLSDATRMIMLAMALDHTRSCGVWYGVWNVPNSLVSCVQHTFRMVPLPKSAKDGDNSGGLPMVCDLNKSSSPYIISKLKSKQVGGSCEDQIGTANGAATGPTQIRMLVNMPPADAARAFYGNLEPPADDGSREALVRLRAKFDRDGTSKLYRVDATDREAEIAGALSETVGGKTVQDDAKESEKSSGGGAMVPGMAWNLLRCFPVAHAAGASANDAEDEVLDELKKKQAELVALEETLQPMARNLLSNAVEERIAYEQPEARHRRAESERILKENEDMVRRRQEMDRVWQDQLEQDMNAVCSICNDGEVTPDNQILFCEACNVAVHQMCYGIEKIPDGDYYCIPCRFFKRDRMMETMSGRQLTDGTAAPRRDLPLLKIVCELCPVKQGAYTRTDTSKYGSEAKWLHMTCAKWQGLDFSSRNDPSLVEDVTELKRHFRRLNISCCICQGMRGAYNQCRHPGCNNWCHVTCARESGLCEVVHGEDVVGFVDENPWTLLCPTHSDKKLLKEEQKKKATPVESLINAAKEFPVEPMPPPRMEVLKPFNKLTGSERKEAFNVRSYEEQFIEEILTKRKAGARCEVCDGVEDDGKNMARCMDCGCMVCVSCQTLDDAEMTEQKSFRCYGCRYEKSNDDDANETPQCSLCHQKGGLLLHAKAKPLSRKSFSKESELKRSLFGRTRFAHILCTFWNKNIAVGKDCVVNTSNVVLSNGRGYVRDKHRCGLCGLKSGLKTRCADQTCRARGETRSPYHFHVTCARQAGLDVSHSDEKEVGFYGKFFSTNRAAFSFRILIFPFGIQVNCYVHGSNEHNLRARLEDLIEVEKRRAGKQLTRSENPMRFADGSRILHNAILVMKILGWSWRWAEWWVEYGSTWEPLLEPGQKEANMTAEELRIVESSKESRRDDARRCRLAAFGAALRNRCYDIEGGFDNAALDRALRALLNTPSLVGPLETYEIDFFADWLGRAYRSKSRLLGFGEEQIPVSSDGFCRHADDNSPKFELGSRPLPGKQELLAGQIFEDPVNEPDDFMKPEKNDIGEVLESTPVPEVNYTHRGKQAAKLEPSKAKKRSAPSRSESTEIEYEQPRKKSRLEPDAADSFERGDGVTLEAHIPTNSLEQSLQTITIRGRPPRVIRLNVVAIVGGERFDPIDESVDGANATATFERQDSSSMDFSRVRLSEVLPQHIEFLRSIGVTSTEQLMSLTNLVPMGAKLVAYRKKKGQLELHSGAKGGANIISKWRSNVKNYAEKHKLFLRGSTSAPLWASAEDSGPSTESEEEEVVNKYSRNSSRRKTPTARADTSDKPPARRKPGRPPRLQSKSLEKQDNTDEHTDSDVDFATKKGQAGRKFTMPKPAKAKSNTGNAGGRQRKRNTAPLEESLSLITSPGREFLQDQGITSAKAMYKQEPRVLGPMYETWRKRNGHAPYKGKGADSQVSRWKKLARDMEFRMGTIADDDEEEDEARMEEKQPQNSPNRGRKRKSSPNKGRRKDLTTTDNFLTKIPEYGIQFLKEQQIDNAKSLLEAESRELSEHINPWRKRNGMDPLKGYGATSMVYAWKSSVRKLALQAGETALAQVGKSPLKKKRKRNRSAKKDESDPEGFDDDLDNDICMYCEQRGDLLICDGCDQSCHKECLKPPLKEIPEGDFFCPECEAKSASIDQDDVCMYCHKVGELLICDGCERSCHMRCLNPPLETIPEGDFFCTDCSSKPAAKVTKSTGALSETDKDEIISPARKDEARISVTKTPETAEKETVEAEPASRKPRAAVSELEQGSGISEEDSAPKTGKDKVNTKPGSAESHATSTMQQDGGGALEDNNDLDEKRKGKSIDSAASQDPSTVGDSSPKKPEATPQTVDKKPEKEESSAVDGGSQNDETQGPDDALVAGGEERRERKDSKEVDEEPQAASSNAEESYDSDDIVI